MLTKISNKITDFMIKNSTVARYSKDVYVYGVELILSTCLCFAGILLSSYLLSVIPSAIIFICIFAPLRTFTGGYHASSYIKCFFISNILYITLLIANYIIMKDIHAIVWWIFLVVFAIYIVNKAPVINNAQPIKEEKQKICKKNTKHILIIDVIGIVILSFVNPELMRMAILCVGLVAVLMLITEMPIYKNKEVQME